MKLKVSLILFNIFTIVFFTVFHFYASPKRNISSSSEVNIKELKVDFKKFIETYNYIPEFSEHFSYAEDTQLQSFENAIDHLLRNDYEKAFENAFSIKYELYKIIDLGFKNTIYMCLIPSNVLKSHHGIFCINQNAKYPHHIAAPHPIKDYNTNIIAVDIFRKNSFKFFSVATAHRCASSATTSCSGTTSVCGEKGLYKISDLAHNIVTYFHRFTTFIHNNEKESIAYQLHGCGKKTCPFGTENDVVFRVSVGTQDILNEDAISNKLNKHLNEGLKKLKKGAVSRSCNKEGEPDYSLCATTNVQGRYINGSRFNPCQETPIVFDQGRFLHIETNFDFRTRSKDKKDINEDLLINSISKMLEKN